MKLNTLSIWNQTNHNPEYAVLVAIGLVIGLAGSAEAGAGTEIRFSALEGTAAGFISGSSGKRAVAAASKGDFSKAYSYAGRNPATRKLVDWFYLQRKPHQAGFSRLVGFLNENPSWPRSKTLRRNIEAVLLRGSRNPSQVIAYFKRYGPISGPGKAALALAYLKSGNKDRARYWTRHGWHFSSMGKKTESYILKSPLRKYIGKADHKLRMDRMLYKRSYSTGMRAAQRLGRKHVALANARISARKRRKTAPKLINKVSGSLKRDPGLLLDRIHWNRRVKKRYDRVIKLIQRAPKSHKQLVDPIAWWSERRIVARLAVGAGQYRSAYRIASSHGFSKGMFHNDGEFLSGFIAFRYLKNNKLALKHFSATRQSSQSPKRIARSEYWLGRVKEKTSREGDAKAHYRNAGQHPYVYYGQLAANRAGKNVKLVFPRPKAPSSGEKSSFRRNELVQSIKLLGKAGKERLASTFFYALASQLKSASHYRLMAELADDLNMKYWVLRAGKLGVKRGYPMAYYAYPRGGVPKLPRTKHVEKAMVYGLIRQESEFNAKAGSHAGAKGLMQIMPGTARYIARQHKMKYSKANLTRRPSYNTRLGTLHLNDLLVRFNGSYIMTIAAYNAGPGHLPKWNGAFGDPRSGGIDPVDWVELIPFTETRNYIKHVMGNTQVYRARFGSKRNPVRVYADLHRGGGITSMISNK